MATPLNGPLTGEIWHLSIEDLLQPLEEAPRLGGPGPFVINLSASSAPIAQPAKQLAAFAATAHVYQIQRTEDRRPRYRLRLGPFSTEDDADALLIKVREIYPSALTATAESDDLRAIASLQAKAEAIATGRHAQRTAAPRPAAPAATLMAVPAASAATESSGAPATAAPRPAPSAPATAAPRPAPSAPVTAAPRPAPSAPVTAAPRPAPSAPPASKPQAAAPTPRAAAPAAPAQLHAAAPTAPQAQPAARAHAVAPTPQSSAPVAPAVAHATPIIHAQPAPKPQAAPPVPQPRAAAPASHPTPSRAGAASEPQPVMTAPVHSLPQPLAIPVLEDTVSLVRRPPVQATSRRAVPLKARAPTPVPSITHKVIPTIIHNMVPTITDEVEFAPPPARTALEAAAPAPVKPAPEAPSPAPVKAAHATPTPAITKTIADSPAPTPVKEMAAAPLIKPAVAAPVQFKAAPQAAPAPIMPVPASPPARRVEALDTPLPNLESTQTLRPLTQLELNDDTVSRWFVIQLSLAEERFDPDSLPNLDIFNEYRLYSVAGIDQGKVMHALRLGFFADEVAAAAVASYLATFYEKPAIKRISTAERDRFSDQRVEARKDVGATGRHAVIEITNERVVRGKRTSATVTPMPARPAPAFQAAGRIGK
jgi:hypothetical protein